MESICQLQTCVYTYYILYIHENSQAINENYMYMHIDVQNYLFGPKRMVYV